jgi:hypothetical protein
VEPAQRRRTGEPVRLAQGQVRLVLADHPDRPVQADRDTDPAKVKRIMEAMLQMKKIDIAALERAHDEE